MKQLGIYSLAAGLTMLLATQRASAAEANAPDFKEVYELIRAHLSGASEAELNRTAVQALVSALSPKVGLAGGTADAELPEAPLVSKSRLFDGEIVYVRVGRVADGLAKAMREACEKAGGTNTLRGVVLDLRYAGGDDYAAAAGAADLFLKKERPLLDWGQGVVRSKPKDHALAGPVAVLVNRQTARAAEALAAALRETGAGLIVGSPTAGQALVMQEYPLKNGSRLRIASGLIRVGNGSPMSAEGVMPDITVELSRQEERAYYDDAFKDAFRTNLLAGAGITLTNQASDTNRARHTRLNEAELVRERRDGFNPDLLLLPEARASEPEKPVVRDPVLGRALDVLTGLAIVRQSRAS